MGSKQKRKGTDFERMLAKRLRNDLGGSWRRIPLSGGAGTQLEIGELKGDIRGYPGKLYPDIRFVIECKAGYGGKNQITVKRDWFLQAKEAVSYDEIPVVALKFDQAKVGNILICFEYEDFVRMIKRMQELLNFDEME